MLKKYLRKLAFLYFRNLWDLIPPPDYAQSITLFNLHRYLGLRCDEINSICLVGGYKGHELPILLKNYPNTTIDVFECSDRYFDKLKKRARRNNRITPIKKAVSNTIGETTFYETNLTGSGSLLKVGPLAQESFGAKQEESFAVQTITLDSYYNDRPIDVLWIDVQGAELLVLSGAEKLLKNVQAVFIEVSVKPNLYIKSTTIDEINNLLREHSFKLINLGLDINLTGNALYTKESC